jgi:hypothetical protein
MRRATVFALMIVLAVVGAYLLGRAQPDPLRAATASQHMPRPADNAGRIAKANSATAAPARRARNLFSALQARANAGDIAASTRLYRDLSLCHRLRAMDWNNALLANELLDMPTNGMLPAQMQDYQAQLDAIDSRRQNAQRLQALCESADAAMMDSLVPSVSRAAQLGEKHARACYLAMGPNYDARALARHPEWIGMYRASVPALIDAGTAAGDWRVVNILRNAYQPGAEGLLAGVLGSDPVQHYRYLKLYRLGAGPGDVDVLDRQLAEAAARLPRERLAEADEWAETAFRRDFAGRPSAESADAGLDPCVFPYE